MDPRALANTNAKPNANSVLANSVLISHRLTYGFTIWLLAVSMMALFCQSAAGQPTRVEQAYEIVDEKWRVVPLRPGASAKQAAAHRTKYRPASNNIRTSQKSARDTLESGEGIATIQPFFLGHVFPMMKVKDEQVVSELGQQRADYVKNYLNSKVTGKTRSDMIAFTITNMQKITADGSLHAANRLSAVYLIGILDDTPAARLQGQVPVPSRSAFSALQRILVSNNAAVPDYLKIAAIAGIKRHLEIARLAGREVPAVEKRGLAQKCMEFLKNEEETPVAYWLKRRSMQVLGMIGDPAFAGPAVAVLRSDAAMPLKLDAVEALSMIPTSSLGAPKNLAAAVAISDFATQAIAQESKNIEAAVGKIVFNGILQQNIDLLAKPVDYQAQGAATIGAAGAMGMGDRGLEFGAPDFGDPFGGLGGGGAVAAGDARDKPQFELPGYQLNLIRRRIKSVAFLSSHALGGENGELGLRQHVADEGKAFVANVVAELKKLLDDSNVGIIDLDNPPEELEAGEEHPGTSTHQLTELCKSSSKELARLLRRQRGEPEPVEEAPAAPRSGNPLDGGPSAPSGNPLDDGGGELAAPANPLEN